MVDQIEVVEAEQVVFYIIHPILFLDPQYQFQLEVEELMAQLHLTHQEVQVDLPLLMELLHLVVDMEQDMEVTQQEDLEDLEEEQDMQEDLDHLDHQILVLRAVLQDMVIQAEGAETLELEGADQAVQPLLEPKAELGNHLILHPPQHHQYLLLMHLEELEVMEQVQPLVEEYQVLVLFNQEEGEEVTGLQEATLLDKAVML